jgi:hypothetical protein
MFDGQLREALSAGSASTNTLFTNSGTGSQQFEVALPHLVLSSGKYAVTLVASDPVTKQFYMRVTNCLFFSMNAIAVSWGTSVVAGEWNTLEKTL